MGPPPPPLPPCVFSSYEETGWHAIEGGRGVEEKVNGMGEWGRRNRGRLARVEGLGTVLYSVVRTEA